MAEREVEHFRARIDAADHDLLKALEDRVRLVVELWQLKQIRRLPRHDTNRESEIVARLASEHSEVLSEESIRDFIQLVLWLSREEATRALARREGHSLHLDD